MIIDSLNSVIDSLFEDESDVFSFNDILYELNIRVIDKDNIRKYFDMLPRHIKVLAIEWGLGDTVFRDMAYSYLLEKLKDECPKIN